MSTHLVPSQSDLAFLRAKLAAIELELGARERQLGALQRELQALQTRYFDEVGAHLARLAELDATIADAEIRAGLRLPAPDETAEPDDPAPADPAVTSSGVNRAGPSRDLKKMFRDLAKALHPDLASDLSLDAAARYRRHSLMAEANRAYEERDEDRLRVIMRVWERAPESVFGDGPDADRLRLERQIAELDAGVIAVEAQLADLRASAICRLKHRIDDARRQGWDLFAEMVMQVKRDITTATAKLASLRRPAVPRP